MKQGIQHNYMLCPLLYFLYINDLPMSVKHVFKVILFADDTSVVVTDKDHDNFKQKKNLDLPP